MPSATEPHVDLAVHAGIDTLNLPLRRPHD